MKEEYPLGSLDAVAQDIIHMPVDRETDSFNSIRNKFYDIMRKHSIKQGTKLPEGKGTVRNNPAWQGAEDMFIARVYGELQFQFSMSETPEDLEY